MKSSGVLVVLFLFASIFSSIAHADQVTLTFQDGDGGAYSSTQGAEVADFSSTGNGSGATLTVSVDYVIADISPGRRIFLRFPDIIGSAVGQIPPGSTVISASLQLNRLSSTTHSVSVLTVTSAWDENTITGLTKPGYANPSSGLYAGGMGPVVISVTDHVQAWASGTPNWGFEISAGYSTTTFWENFYSDDAATVSDRPLLSVTFTPPPVQPVEQSTWGKVKALYR